MGQVFIWCERTLCVRPREEVWAERAQVGKSGQIIKDIEPYRSIIDGQVIGGRKQHRDMLKARNMAEVGNDLLSKQKAPERGPREVYGDVKRAWDAVTDGRAERPRMTRKQFETL